MTIDSAKDHFVHLRLAVILGHKHVDGKLATSQVPDEGSMEHDGPLTQGEYKGLTNQY